ncbi:glyoxalase [bacterium SCN 62-11]|nr:VOC family protein [Candidatus Eremiobacteraeota bacterium]ODT62650.1 MAG: glyoxalase [bacterium SCN 62-11]
MAVKRIVSNIKAADPQSARQFYGEIFDLEIVMDQGWIVTFASDGITSPQLSVASQGGSGTPVPDLSIEVDNWDEVLSRIEARAIPLEYGPAEEPWGVRRFFVRDPFGRLVNVLTHSG